MKSSGSLNCQLSTGSEEQHIVFQSNQKSEGNGICLRMAYTFMPYGSSEVTKEVCYPRKEVFDPEKVKTLRTSIDGVPYSDIPTAGGPSSIQPVTWCEGAKEHVDKLCSKEKEYGKSSCQPCDSKPPPYENGNVGSWVWDIQVVAVQGTVLGSVLGYLGYFEVGITLIVLFLFLRCGVVKNYRPDFSLLKVSMDEDPVREVREMQKKLKLLESALNSNGIKVSLEGIP